GQDIRVVIAVEFPAVTFLLQQRDRLFPHAQAVVCSIPRFEDDWRPAWATGQLENSDPAGIFRLATHLHAGLKTLVIPDDDSNFGPSLRRGIIGAIPDAEKKVKIEIRPGNTVQEIYDAVEHLPADSAVLLPRSRTVSHLIGEMRLRCPVP